ncbi:hypothetical protein BDV96DRAFT_373014 [Lophiotrema nucula]|uniref:Zn(2)-C6 fungal-type domain-containing protein n=1 Tax=Lophiotrema nucula TaxID=690887 RepID=A0A6A5YH51_9PLEO|nr:hypothetical protein BDV96DRAFT_373014 [Lophiotrema nucula]
MYGSWPSTVSLLPSKHTERVIDLRLSRDALQRHELLHQETPNLLRQGGRACTNCVTAKVRCSGGTSGCARCQNRGRSCIYLHQSPKPPANPSITFPADDSSIRGTNPDFSDFLDDDLFNADILATTNWLDALADCPPDFRFSADLDNAFPSESSLLQRDPLESPSTASLSQVTGDHPPNDPGGQNVGEFYVHWTSFVIF